MEKDYTPHLAENKYACCGCTACFCACPVHAVSMKADEEGFLYPEVNPDICIGCGKCEQVCQLKHEIAGSEPLTIFASKNKDGECRMASSSGGIFSLLAEYMERQGGSVYGAAFDEHFNVCHKRAQNREEWQKFLGSKYVQSDLKDCYESVKNDLESHIPVLFSGTPCQIEGLKQYLGNTDTSGLLTCDVICHGAPSPLIWQKWLLDINDPITGIRFRDKEKTGWHHSSLVITGEGEKILVSGTHSENAFSRMFFRHFIIRPSCHKCPYASFERCSDITLGDYWGVEKQFAQQDDDKGISLVLCNTEKGLDVWNQISEKTDSFTVTRKQCEQPSLLHPTEEPKSRKLFWKIYQRHGLKAAMKFFRLVPLSAPEKAIIKLSRIVLRAAGQL